jgi:putative alpha-1,2-mannosidase
MWAQRAGRNDLYRQTLLPRGDYWKNTYNPAVGYQAARKADGSWQAGFTRRPTTASRRARAPRTPGWCRRTSPGWPR